MASTRIFARLAARKDARLSGPCIPRTVLPSEGLQFFGLVKIEGATGQMTVTLRDRGGAALWSTTLDPKRT